MNINWLKCLDVFKGIVHPQKKILSENIDIIFIILIKCIVYLKILLILSLFFDNVMLLIILIFFFL